jgi:hypothetical protein
MKKSPATKSRFVLALMVCLLVLLADVYADTHNAASCSRDDVQAAIDAASNGDTVIVPAGTVTWDSGITISKGILVQGAGMDKTVIITPGGNSVNITNNTGYLLRVTGFTFDGTGYEWAGYGQCINIGDAKDFRIDHIELYNQFNGISVNGIAEGLVDNCTYYIHETKHYYTPFPFMYNNVSYDDPSCSHWNYYSEKSLTPGTSMAWYIEDCYIDMDEDMFRSSGILYAGDGGRVVFRYNTGYGPVDVCELYGISGWRPARSFSWAELYENKIHFKNYGYSFQFRGGTGVVFDNEITGDTSGWGNDFNLRNDRSCGPLEHYYCEGSIVVRSDQCDGTSPCDGNTPGMNGYPCLDQIGMGPGPMGSQSHEPLYSWNNTYNGAAIYARDINQCPAETSHVLENRDFYNDTPRPGYTPYQYPHPLQGAEPPPPDTTPPDDIATVNDGTGTDIDSTMLATQLSANWTAATDNESPITNYHYAIGTTPGGTQTLGWQILGNVLTVTKTDLTLTIGATYYFSVKAQSAGGTSSATNSDGQWVEDVNDTTPPDDIATVNDGTGSDTDSIPFTTELSANWTPSADGESDISKYWYAIGTTQGGTDEIGWTSTSDGTVTNVTRPGLTLSIGTTYYFTVKAENGVLLQSNPTSSDGQCVLSGGTGDGTPPVISGVNEVNITMTGVTITWDTDEPATSQVKYGATASYGNNTAEDSNLVTSHSVNLTDLIPGVEYHYRVISKDSSDNEKISVDCKFTTQGEDEIDAKVYPSPYNPSKGSSMRFSVDRTTGGEVKIYTISGKLVKTLLIQSGESEVNWDVLNEEGNSITAGLYIYTITDGEGNKKTGKIAITQ